MTESIPRDASDEEKIQYISKTYGVPVRPLRFPMVSLSLTIQTKNTIRPTSIYAVLQGTCPIPLETGNPELDFINELYATVLTRGFSYISRLKMVNLSSLHGDHNHYIKVHPAGLVDYLAHRLPTIQSPYKKETGQESRRGCVN